MNELRIYNRNGGLYVTSREVAHMIGLPHDQLVIDITRIAGKLEAEGKDISEKFIPRKQGSIILSYLLSRSGCDMVALLLIPDETMKILFANEYTDRFRKREKVLENLLSAPWRRKRQLNKAGQKDFSDKIKELVEYAESCGSKSAFRYYTLYSNLLNNAVGLESGDRDMATSSQLEELNKLNMMAGNIIRQGIADGIDYHDIYKNVRTRVEWYKEFQNLTMPKLPQEVE